MNSLKRTLTQLGAFGEIVATIPAPQRSWAPEELPSHLIECLGMPASARQPADPTLEREWEADGVHGRLFSWSVGYGPKTEAYWLRPERGPVKAGIVALHDHSGFKFFGKEKIADGPDAIPPTVAELRAKAYGGRAYANELARRGFDVLVPDTFLWGSRRFDVLAMPAGDRLAGRGLAREQGVLADPVKAYNAASILHEHTVEKALRLLGTCMAGVVNFEDRMALQFFRNRLPAQIPVACIGLSGGGLRSAMLSATSPDISAAVVVGMMATYESLLNGALDQHTWMLYPPGWSPRADFPDIAGCRAPRPLLVQYDRHDCLFSIQGMETAHQHLKRLYTAAGNPGNYEGTFYDGDHKFDRRMQEDAFAWLENVINSQ